MKRNILVLSHTGGTGGGERVLLDAISTLASCEKYNIYVAYPVDADSGFKKALETIDIAGSHSFRYRVARNTTPLLLRNIGYGILFGLLPLVHYARKRKIELVYINSSVNLIGVILANLLNVPYVWHIHEQSNDHFRWTPRWMVCFYKKWLFSHRCHSIFVSEMSRQMWLREISVNVFPRSSVVYPKYRSIEPSGNERPRVEFVFGFLGALSPNKNVTALIRVFSELSLPHSLLLIGGDGPLRDGLEKDCADKSNIRFLGPVSDVSGFYKSIDVMVVPSFNESWGLVALEAMSAGIPVIITRNSGLTEIFEQGKHCLFFDPHDQTQLVNAMRRLQSEPELRHKLAQNAVSLLVRKDINGRFEQMVLQIINNAL